MSEVRLVRDDRWGNVPELLFSAIEADLRDRQYAEPHGDAHIAKLDMAYGTDGLRAVVQIAVTTYPSCDEVRDFYESGWEGVIALPTPRVLCHTLKVNL